MSREPKKPRTSSKTVVNDKWFRDQLKRMNVSQREVARLLGINQAVISHMFNGTRKMPLDEVPKWAKILGVPESDILTNAGIQSSTAAALSGSASLEISGWVDGELSVHFNDKKGLKGPLSAPNPLTETMISVVRCQTAGSPFEGMDGALLYFQNHGIFDPEAIGRLCIVKIQDRFLVRTVKRGYEPGKHNLALPNGTVVEEGVIVDSAAPIVWMKL